MTWLGLPWWVYLPGYLLVPLVLVVAERRRRRKEGTMAVSKDLRKLMRSARKQGWTVQLTSGGHIKWSSPEGPFVIGPQTPSDHRSIQNLRSRLRRAGLKKKST